MVVGGRGVLEGRHNDAAVAGGHGRFEFFEAVLVKEGVVAFVSEVVSL